MSKTGIRHRRGAEIEFEKVLQSIQMRQTGIQHRRLRQVELSKTRQSAQLSYLCIGNFRSGQVDVDDRFKDFEFPYSAWPRVLYPPVSVALVSYNTSAPAFDIVNHIL